MDSSIEVETHSLVNNSILQNSFIARVNLIHMPLKAMNKFYKARLALVWILPLSEATPISLT